MCPQLGGLPHRTWLPMRWLEPSAMQTTGSDGVNGSPKMQTTGSYQVNGPNRSSSPRHSRSRLFQNWDSQTTIPKLRFGSQHAKSCAKKFQNKGTRRSSGHIGRWRFGEPDFLFYETVALESRLDLQSGGGSWWPGTLSKVAALSSAYWYKCF